ncbi:hypothetical protein L6R53_24385 [Myxococcota bacterium]|nr:hypothetical protein [Myxococcota bacterium]
MARGNLPDEVIRLLSFHGPVELWTGEGSRAATQKVHVAPFDDELILLVPPTSPLVGGLLQTSKAMVTARAEDQRYTLRLEGRAVAGRPVPSHRSRGSITPWLPEGQPAHRFLAVTFIADKVELVREEGQVHNRYAGPTPTGRALPPAWRRWLSAALGEGGRWLAITGLVGPFAWFGYQGSDYPFRPLALLLAWTASLGLVAGIRLLGQSGAFTKWRAGDGDLSDAPFLRDGWLAPDQARLGGMAALLAATVASGLLAAFPSGLASIGVVLLSTGAPVLAASWLLHGTVRARDGESG